MASRVRLILSIAFFVWVAFVLVAYYAVQKPIMAYDTNAIANWFTGFESTPTPGGILAAALDLLIAAGIGFAALLAGARLMPLPYPGADAPLWMRAEYWLLSAGLGFGLIAIAMLVLALVGVLSPALMVIFAVLLLVITRRSLWPQLISGFRAMAAVKLPLPLLIFLLLSLALTLLVALSPPIAWDSHVYHLTLPQRVLMAGRLLPFGDIIPHEDFPMLMPSLYLLAMLIRGDIAAQCVHFVFGLMTLGLIALTTRQVYSRGAVPVALAIALSIPILLQISSWAYSDIALTFYTLAAVYAYLRWLEEHKKDLPLPQASPAGTRPATALGFLFIAGLMAGFALGLKYTSFLLPLGLAVFLLRDARGSRVRTIAVFALACAAAAAPWYLKNLWFTGNPVYPFVFGGPQWDDLRAAWYAQAGTGIGFDIVTLVTLPVITTQGFRDANFVDGRIGPLLLLLVPLLVLRRSRIDRFVALFLLYYAAWIAGVVASHSLWQARLLLPGVVLLVPPLADAVAQLKAYDVPSFSLFRITKIIVALVLGLALVTQTAAFVNFNPVAYVVGAETREHFMVRQDGAIAPAMEAVRRLPPNARVQFLWESRSYLAERAARADVLLDALPHLVATTGSVDASVRRLKAEGFTHVLVWEAYVTYTNANLRDQSTERDAENLRQLERDYAQIVYENSAYRLLELK